MTARTERALCLTAVGLLWMFFFVQALHTPTLLDDWYQVAWHRHHTLTPVSIWEYGHYNYFNFNPRIGDVLLVIVDGPRWIHLALTPIVQLAILPLAFAITFARAPRLTLRDFQLLLVLQVFIWLVIPIPGIIYFYRPFTTNYLWSFAFMLALFVPYRLALAGSGAAHRRIWATPLMLALGWIAGMGNEHTGPTAMVVMAAFLYVAWRRRGLQLWMVAGALGLFIGYPMLFFAPGQALRYAGIATRDTPLYLLRTRGISGTFGITLEFVAEAQLAIDLALVAVLVAYRRARARGASLAALSRGQILAALALIFSAGSMVATLFASPTVGERFFFAPAILFVGALLIVVDWVLAESAARRFLLVTCGLVFAFHIYRMADLLAVGYAENQARMAMLESAPDNSVQKVPPYSLWKRSRWWWGDDFSYASLREYVANEVYDLRGIEYDRYLHWAEPTPPDRFVATRTFEPPLAAEEDAKLQPRYIPSFWEWSLVQLRRSMKLGPIALVKDHTLVRYTVDLERTLPSDPLHRPIHVFDWTPTKQAFVDGRMFDDPDGYPYVRIWAPSLPQLATELYVEGCGTTKRVEAKPDIWADIGPLVPIDLQCRGTYTVIVCEPTQCWLAGRYWR